MMWVKLQYCEMSPGYLLDKTLVQIIIKGKLPEEGAAMNFSEDFRGEFRIRDRVLSQDGPPYVIAEIGVNHNGDMSLAKQSIEAAARSGADAVKFQSFRAEEFMADRDRTYTYRSQGNIVEEPMYSMFKRLELSYEDHQELLEHSRSQGVEFLSSAADREAVDLLIGLEVPVIKIASEDLINRPLLEYVARKGVPVILSTGMADHREIDEALSVFEDAQAPQPLLLHCVSLYPTPDEEANLYRIKALQERYGRSVGFSDHTIGPEAALAATALGAVLIEKHFTIDQNLPGPDHTTSIDPVGLEQMLLGIRKVALQRGSGQIDPAARESHARIDFRRSIVATCSIPSGEEIHEEMLALKRPGTGIHPRHLSELVGRRVNRLIAEDEQIAWEDLIPLKHHESGTGTGQVQRGE